MEDITGYIERITFQNQENQFTVAKLKEKGKRDLTCIVGSLPSIQPGETLKCYGTWYHDPSHGRQFKVDHYQVQAPADLIGIQKYLSSGLIKGIGAAYAKRIIDTFGMDTLLILDQTSNRLSEVPGLGDKRIQGIITCWKEQKSVREVMIFLQSHNISPAYAQRIYKCYGNKSIAVVKHDPYCLARDVFGIGFKMADKVASSLDISFDSPERVNAGVEFALGELSSDGHVCYPKEELTTYTHNLIQVNEQLIEQQLQALHAERRIIISELEDGYYVWIKPLYMSEIGIAKEVARLQDNPDALRSIETTKAINWAQENLHLKLAVNQHQAVEKALLEKLLIITGGPGTGKSTITKAILTIIKKLSDHILLAAPTGRAAKRMQEITGCFASTIHSLLEFDFKKGGFKRNRDNPLTCDLIIIDEVSMIDTYLMYQLLKTIPNHARVILIGDIDQLPSVGPGNVLQDMILSKKIPYITLKEIFRQARGSKIITNAHRINDGIFPDIKGGKHSDFFFLLAKEPAEVLSIIQDLVKTRLPKSYHFDPIHDIQVLSPMKKGIIGSENLNATLQQTLNPGKDHLVLSGRAFAPKDKVMQIRNNYKKEIFNGDMGIIQDINEIEQTLIVNFDNKPVSYGFSEIEELVLAYAASIHKYQGSEAPCIIIPIHTHHFKLLNRNLLYTGVTRGKKLVILVGTKQALAIAIKNDEVKRRYTGLNFAIKNL